MNGSIFGKITVTKMKKKINEQTKNIYRKAYINSRLVHLYNDNNVTKGLWIIIIEK